MFHGILSDYTQSQLAKDHEEHPFHPLAAELAGEVVLDLGQAMKDAWSRRQTDVTPLMQIVRDRLIHPEHGGWMDQKVLDWAKRHPQAIRKATDRGWLAEHLPTHAALLHRQAGQLISHSQDLIRYYRRLREMERAR